MHFSERSSTPTMNKKSTFIKNTEYAGILKADQLVYHSSFKMFEIAKYWNKMLQYHSSIHYSGIVSAFGLV